jgi:hypothetical protein
VPEGEPTTRPLSLTDELFGIGTVDEPDDSTLQLPRVHHRRDDP